MVGMGSFKNPGILALHAAWTLNHSYEFRLTPCTLFKSANVVQVLLERNLLPHCYSFYQKDSDVMEISCCGCYCYFGFYLLLLLLMLLCC